MTGKRLSIKVRSVSFPIRDTGRRFHVNGITVNKTTQTVESAAAGGVILDLLPADDGRLRETRIDTHRPCQDLAQQDLAQYLA
jgi:starch synthase (maltosyl-transferring)